MKRLHLFLGVLLVVWVTTAGSPQVSGQGRETFTGTVLSYGSGFNTRTVTSTFTLHLTGQTSDQQATGFLNTLRENGQDRLLDAIDNQDLGRFSVGSNVGVPINVVRETRIEDRRRLFIVFRRWTQFAEQRGGYRSLDYPFGVIELFIDDRTGKGEGTYIAAARIRWDRDEKNNRSQIEIENFATYPARLLGVTQRNKRPS